MLLSDDRQPAVVTELVGVVDAEVKAKKGLGGTAIKAAYAAASKVSPGLTGKAVTRMLPDFADALDPYWTEFAAAGGGDFGAFLASRGTAVAGALLAVTDRRIEGSSKDVLKKAYRGIRGKAQENVTAALPRVGAAVQRHAS